ncbi:MAG TPA: NfeD family protein [Bacteroidales bacterium]|nr:NfeD family protein [Bacteroidales bacterium]
MFWLVVVTLILIGLAFLLLEILVIPGTGIAGIIGFILIGIGVWQAYEYYGASSGHWVLAGTFGATIVVLVLSLRSKTWRRVMLNSEIDSRVNLVDEINLKRGDAGRTVSRLAPMGKALFGTEYYEVRTQGDFLDPGTEIEIEKIEDHKIFVKRKI